MIMRKYKLGGGLQDVADITMHLAGDFGMSVDPRLLTYLLKVI